jgi:hypothetical protein
MAKESRREQSATELKAEIARSRDRLARDLRVFRREIDIPRRIKRSFQQQTVAWVAAAVVVGALLIILPARRKTVYVRPKGSKGGKRSQRKLLEAGAALGAVKFAASVLRPVIISFITKKVRGYVNDSQMRGPGARKHGLFQG